jgi:hypothetical protein
MYKASLLTGDFYVLNVIDDKNAPKCICIAAVLDYWLYNRKPKESLEYRLKFADTFE